MPPLTTDQTSLNKCLRSSLKCTQTKDSQVFCAGLPPPHPPQQFKPHCGVRRPHHLQKVLALNQGRRLLLQLRPNELLTTGIFLFVKLQVIERTTSAHYIINYQQHTSSYACKSHFCTAYRQDVPPPPSPCPSGLRDSDVDPSPCCHPGHFTGLQYRMRMCRPSRPQDVG